MRKGKSIIGKDVLSLEDGVKLDSVNDVVVDALGRRVIALVVDEGGFMSSSKVVPFEEISSFGKDAVVVRATASVMSASERDDLRAMLEHDEKILGKKVFTTTGDDQGSIGDIYFDERSGDVVGYEVSGGLIGDASKGTSYLASDEIAEMGTDVIYVRPETAAVLDEQVGGLRGAVKDAGAKFGQAKQTTGQKAGESGAAAQQSTETELIGRKTGSDVESDDGSVIVPKGRRVRTEDVEAAKGSGKLQALTASVAMGGAQDAGAGAKDALGAAGDSAGNLWDQFTAKIGEMTDATGKRMDEGQTKKRLGEIADAIGRPVTKVILDREDKVILNLGDIITHGAIQRAHDSGGLNSLLESAYKGTVEFTKEEMRAPAEVEAEAEAEKSSGGAAIVDELETKVEDAEKEREAEKERKKVEDDAGRERRKAERESRGQEREAAREERKSESAKGSEEREAAKAERESTSAPAERKIGDPRPASAPRTSSSVTPERPEDSPVVEKVRRSP